MRCPLIIALAFAAVPLCAASAEEAAGGLPPACVAAARPAEATSGMENMDGMDHGADGSMAMHDDMATAATIPDPDLAFNCGMIAHHQGAITMAETELAKGKDPASLALARTIIEAQKREIAEMTAWVAQHGAAK